MNEVYTRTVSAEAPYGDNKKVTVSVDGEKPRLMTRHQYDKLIGDLRNTHQSGWQFSHGEYGSKWPDHEKWTAVFIFYKIVED